MGSSKGEPAPVKIAGFGRYMIGRDIGLEIRRQHFSGPLVAWPTTLDFRGVEQATESCIDELLGTLARENGLGPVAQLRIVNASAAVKETIDYVLSIVAEPPPLFDSRRIRSLLSESRRPSRARSTKRTSGKKKASAAGNQS